MPSRILVVEDNDLEQSALRAAFEHEGYLVDSVSDGLSAVRKLRSGNYDLALVDYHIPEVDGLASAKLLHELMDGSSLPKLVAITASSSELEARQGKDGIFDAIVPKPYDLGEVLRIVSNEIKGSSAAARSAAADEMWRSVGLERRPTALVAPTAMASQDKILQYLFDVRGRREPEVIVVADGSGLSDVADLRENSDYFRCPVIDLTGEFAGLADATLTDFRRGTLFAVAKTIRQFSDRLGKLAPTFRHANRTEDRLLAYLFLSGRELRAERFAQSKSFVRYAGFFSPELAMETAGRLQKRGLLEKTFFDRIHVCAQCSSARLNAREECPSCRSSYLQRKPLIHHFRCAYQAPEDEFLQDRELVCPKCRQHLRHYGSDYDKPAEVCCCAECGEVCSDPAVGFVCFDCGVHVDGDAVSHRDIFNFMLTDAGIKLLTATSTLPELEVSPRSQHPRELIDALVRMRNMGSPHERCTIIEITYPPAKRIIAKVGQHGFKCLRDIFIHNLAAALPEPAEIFTEGDRDFLLHPGSAADVSDDLLDHCQDSLAERLDPQVRCVELSKGEGPDGRPALCH